MYGEVPPHWYRATNSIWPLVPTAIYPSYWENCLLWHLNIPCKFSHSVHSASKEQDLLALKNTKKTAPMCLFLTIGFRHNLKESKFRGEKQAPFPSYMSIPRGNALRARGVNPALDPGGRCKGLVETSKGLVSPVWIIPQLPNLTSNFDKKGLWSPVVLKHLTFSMIFQKHISP